MRGLAPTSKTVNAKLARVTALVSFAIVVAVWPAHAEGWQHVGAVQHVEKLPDGVELSAGRAKRCNQTGGERFGFDDQVQFNHPPLTESVLEWTVS